MGSVPLYFNDDVSAELNRLMDLRGLPYVFTRTTVLSLFDKGQELA